MINFVLMYRIFFIVSFIFLLNVSHLLAQQFQTIELGVQCPGTSIEMISVDGATHTLDNHFNKKGLLVVFTSNTCPFVVAWEDRYKMMEGICEENNVDMLYINSNHNKRDGDDSFEEMQNHAKFNGYQYPYLLDEKSKLANAFGAKTTPHIFLFDSNKKLVYVGAIDDNYKSVDNVSTFYLKDAIESLVAGNEIQPSQTKAVGCSIKRYKP